MLKQLRLKSGYTQIELSNLIGISQKCLSLYENGDRKLPVSIAKKIGQVLHIDWPLLYEDEAQVDSQ